MKKRHITTFWQRTSQILLTLWSGVLLVGVALSGLVVPDAKGNVPSSTFPTEGECLRVLSFNIRYDNPSDAPHHWAARKEAIATFLHQAKPDLIGMQEVLHHQMEEIQAMLPSYGCIGVGRDDGKQAGEYAPIFYNKARLELKESGYFWLSPTPKEPSLGWDAACPRIVTWGYFYDKEADAHLACYNIHLDHHGPKARTEGLQLLQSQMKRYTDTRTPTLLVGDFNASPTSAPMVQLFGAEEEPKKGTPTFHDSYHEARERKGPVGTFHGFGKVPLKRRERIDYILYTDGLTPHTYEAIHPATEGAETRFLSDHTPILATFSYDHP